MRKLTLAYPAYRRPDLLAGALKSVILSGQGEDVEILICDDSTERLNEQVAEQVRDSGLKVRYVANASNLGIDANIKQCFDLAQTDYCWTIGEDDWITGSGLAAVLDAINSGQHQIYFTDYVYCSNDYGRILSRPLLAGLFPGSKEAVLASFHRFGFVGSFIIRRDLWAEITPLAPVGTYYHHLSVIGYALFSLNSSFGYINEICVKNRAEDGRSASWVRQALEVHFGYYRAIAFFESFLNPEQQALLRIKSRELFRPYSVAWLLSKRADGAFTYDDVSHWYGDQPVLRRTLYRAVSVVPVQLASLLKDVYAIVKRLRAGSGQLGT